jgi:hypothetical protein
MGLDFGKGSGGKMKKSLSSRVLILAVTSLVLGALSPYSAIAAPTAKISEVTVNKKSFAPGEKIVVTYSVTSTELNSSHVNQVSIAEESEPDDCEERCYLSTKPKLVSGNISSGFWQAELTIPKNFYGGKYNLFVGYIKLSNGSLSVTPITISGPPIPRPLIPTANITSYKLNKTAFVSGEKVILDFQVKTQDLPAGSIPIARIVNENESDDCENYCSMSAKPVLLKGNVQDGAWRATFALSKSFYGGSYYVIFGYIKIRGESFKSLPVEVDGPPAPVKPPEAFIDDLYYEITEMKVSSARVPQGGIATGTFILDTNDPTVRSPECMLKDASDWSDAVRTTGTYMSGSWKCSVAIPSKMPIGTYILHVAVVGSANNEKNETREDIGEISVTAKSSSNSLKSTTSGSILCSKSGTFKYFPKVKTCPEGWVRK